MKPCCQLPDEKPSFWQKAKDWAVYAVLTVLAAWMLWEWL